MISLSPIIRRKSYCISPRAPFFCGVSIGHRGADLPVRAAPLSQIIPRTRPRRGRAQSAKPSLTLAHSSALRARANFGRLLRRVDQERRSLVIEKRGTPKAVLLSIRDYVRLAAPEPEVLRAIGEESRRKGTDKLSSRQIDQVIKATRAQKLKRG